MKKLLAQINIGEIIAPVDDPLIADFNNNLDKINALAESSPGFIWRLKDDNNNATSFNPYGDERVIVNISVWESAQALRDFAYHSEHVQFLKRRKEWFLPMDKPHMTLWWTNLDHLPDANEGKERLDHLWAKGPSTYSFDFRTIHQFS